MLEQQEYIGLLIGAARRRLKQAVLTRLVPHRLSTQQFWILLAIRDLPGASLGAVAERQRLDLPTASRVVTSLCERGLVLLERSLDDRRRASVKLTTKGEALTRKLQPIADSARAAVVQGLSAAEQETLRKLLRRVIANLDAHVAEAHPVPVALKRKAVRA
jgi:DNA-binding MarR family transcriptional regulator